MDKVGGVEREGVWVFGGGVYRPKAQQRRHHHDDQDVGMVVVYTTARVTLSNHHVHQLAGAACRTPSNGTTTEEVVEVVFWSRNCKVGKKPSSGVFPNGGLAGVGGVGTGQMMQQVRAKERCTIFPVKLDQPKNNLGLCSRSHPNGWYRRANRSSRLTGLTKL
jgi:hypothetical protein